MDDRRDNIGGGGRCYGPPPPDLSIPPPPAKMRRKQRRQPPQETVSQFWDKLNPKHPGKVYTVLPNNPYARKKAAKTPHGTVCGQRAAKSYEEARAECERDVNRIIKECRRLNQKYRDMHFDIEWDLKSGQRNCLDGLSTPGDSMKPKGVKRVTDIFENPQFFINGPTAGDVRQGRDGDCYLMAALCGLGNMPGLIDKVCVKHDKDVGVYGFVFFRDGEWQHTIIDDKLYTRAPDYDEAQDERVVWDDINRVDSAEEYRKAHLTGSRALYFAQCSDENETWLPLLEKAYAKAHGDFASIDGGFTGEAIEDLTGGVTTEIYSTDILDREAFWRDELMHVGSKFLFGCATGFYANWLDTSGAPREREGISEGHAYSIMDAREIKGQRLLKLRNPWGKKEWTGKWSDGSSEWTPEWMQLLEHKFGNDGIFWISYEDLLKKYQHFDRTRIFGPEWNVTQCWTSVNVSWSAEYHSTKFSLTLQEKAPVVIVLAQLDDTYFGGLEGGYEFDLQFRLESDDKEDENDYIVRSNGNYAMARSVSTDIELEAGTYSVLMKITATRNTDREHVEDVLPVYAATRREKLIRMGLSYDLAHAKGVIVETEAERKERKAREKVRRAKEREKMKQRTKAQAEKHWRREKKRHELEKERLARNKQRKERKKRVNRETGGVPVGLGMEGHVINENAQNKEMISTTQNEHVDEVKVLNPGSEATEIKSSDGVVVRMSVKGPAELSEEPNPIPISQKKPAEEITADKLVEPLEEVIKVAEAEDRANEPEDLPDKESAEPESTTSGANGASVQASGPKVITDIKPLSKSPPLSRPQHEISKDTNSGYENASVTKARRGPQSTMVNGPCHRKPPRSDTLNTTAAMLGIGSGADGSEYDVQEEDGDDLRDFDSERENVYISKDHLNDGGEPVNDDEVSDADSFPPFDWNSELDMSPYLSSSDDADSDSSSTRTFAPGLGRLIRRNVARGRRRGRSRSPLLNPPLDIDGSNMKQPNNDRAESDGDGPEEPWNAVCVVGLRVYSTLQGAGIKLKVVRPSGYSDDEEAAEPHKTAKGAKSEKDVEKKAGADPVLDPDDISKGAVAAEPESTGVVVAGERERESETRDVKPGDRVKLGSSTRASSGGGRNKNKDLKLGIRRSPPPLPPPGEKKSSANSSTPTRKGRGKKETQLSRS
ncbi:uncharacterized protein Z519_09180 [Cladophialophora bantiana CBS 173.52]|uniref:Calpain catalytic domain-containing protein n=1 Tax=Cladophialophora bantiana (strain ATCC 10958 / CBS 173.52 / CDC B-1940 / NIH 8579) TaxID=1442370 RepID=A0A0D2HBE6_CLAB1|nr:uncharacterized protein Z519_09180 [Cladophialophora bantiana CBS 173.52]KIW90533.1 hypothetical protein Z519_09180 [Cladophialophora bantiana CBS 173.52]